MLDAPRFGQDDNKTMSGKRLRVLLVVATVAAVCVGLWFLHRLRDRREAGKREVRYQAILTQYEADLKPGMRREQVERYLHTNGKPFSQMCCAGNFRGEYVSLVGAGWDDLIKIADEPVPIVCGENNVYIALEFNPKSRGEQPDTNASDILKRVLVLHKLEKCL